MARIPSTTASRGAARRIDRVRAGQTVARLKASAGNLGAVVGGNIDTLRTTGESAPRPHHASLAHALEMKRIADEAEAEGNGED